MKRTKTKLISSITVLIVCFAMLIGSTFAWFTDSASTGVNRIQAGNLDVKVLHTNAKGKTSEIESKTDLFLNEQGNPMVWEPGAVAYETFTVKNVGSLAFKYAMGLSIDSYTTVNERSLLEVLKVAIVNARPTNRDEAISLFNSENSTNIKDINDAVRDNAVTGLLFGDASSNHLSSGNDSKQEFTMIIYWPSDTDTHSTLSDYGLTDNDFNMNNDKQGNILDVGFKIQLTATQYTEENDSFNDQYDRDAIYALDPVTTVNKESEVASKTINEDGSVSYTSGAAPTTRSNPLYVTSITFKSETNYNELNVNVDTTNTLFNIKKNQSVKVASLNITANKQGTPVHEFVTGEKALIKTYISTGLSNVTVEYLYENGTAEIWGDGTNNYTDIDNLSSSNHGLYYDAVTGQIAFITTHFSEFSASAMGAVAYTQNDDTDNAYTTYADAATASKDVEVKLPVNITQDEMKEAQQAAAKVPGSSFSLTENQVNKNDDLTEQFFEARIGKQYYATLSSAVENANINDTIYLIKDIEVNNTVDIKCSLTVDLNGYYLNLHGADGFMVDNSNLSLCDTSVNQTGLLEHDGRYDIADLSNSGTISIDSGRYIANGTYVFWLYGGESNITGGYFNRDDFDCREGYELIKDGNWYVPQRYYMWKDYAAEQFSNIDETAKTIKINSAEELALLAKNVNNGITYNGYTVTLMNDIDLSGRRWTPIGNGSNKFGGVFDGCNYTISNLDIKLPGKWSVGLFSQCNNTAKIQNLTLDNVEVVGGHATAAVLGGSGGAEAKLSDITVSGSINLKGGWYTGTIFGYGYTTISNCHVDADLGSYVGGGEGNGYAGGIVGFMGEGNNGVYNCSVNNLLIEASWNGIGGISGILHYGNTIDNCQVTNTIVHQCTDDSDEIGRAALIAGTYLTKENYTETLTNCTFTNGKVYDDVNDYTTTGKWIGGPWGGHQDDVGQLIVEENVEQ